VDVGQTVAASLQAPTLFSIARDLTQMQVEASIDEADIGRIREGQNAVCRFDAWPGESFEAIVSQKRLNPEIVSNVVTYVVILNVDNDENKLMPGMTANLSIETDRRDDVLKLPAAALRFNPPADVIGDGENRGDARTVWLVEDGRLTGSLAVNETGVSDRSWIELRGDALSQIREGQELAVGFTLETKGMASAGGR
jgi:HlyD family secretion protein